MSKYKLPYFIELDLDNPEDFYEVEMEFEEHSVSIEIDFEGGEPSEELLDKVKSLLVRLPELNAKVKTAIRADFENGSGFVGDYIGFFQGSLEGSDDYASFVDEANADKSADEQLVEQFYLTRVGIYPGEETYAIFDYTISREHTDDLLVVYLTEDGELDGMTIES